MNQKLEIAHRLKVFVEENFRTTAEFARRLGMPRQNIYPYIKGSSLAGAELLTKFAALGCDINWLLTGEKSQPIIKEKEVGYGGLSLGEQVELLKEKCQGLETELQKLKHKVTQLKKDHPPRPTHRS